MLEHIKTPKDLKGLSYGELKALASEIRDRIIEVSNANGGHLASNLGMVETTLAIHRVFDTPRDCVVFDVGHQCYTHKLITGRNSLFDTLRQGGGISGFTNREESEYDIFTEGHSGTSLSQALGMCAAFERAGLDRYVVAIIGDGSFTNGMIYEALNNCKTIGHRLIIILNDNEMSISKNVGGLSQHLTRIRTSQKYFNIKHRIKDRFKNDSGFGRFAKRFRDFARRALVHDNLFECMGIDYIGPVDGGDIKKLETILEEAKTKGVCTIVHIHTKKGKGHTEAETNPERFHSVAGTPVPEEVKPKMTFSKCFGDTVTSLCEKDSRICAITAAMGEGTGLGEFSEKYPKNFYDVGIAEEHAVTFSAGLAAGGAKPVTALYSTFSQRVYDQIQHDVAIQHLPFVLCLDRAGLVEGDGITHQGIFDVSLFSGIPGVNIYSPETYKELEEALTIGVDSDEISIIRYPRGGETEYERDFQDFATHSIKCFGTSSKARITLITYGRVTAAAYKACETLVSMGIEAVLIKLVKIFPTDFVPIEQYAKESSLVYVLEEGIKSGGIGEKIASHLPEWGISTRVKIHAIDSFVSHGSLSQLMEQYGFTPENIVREIKEEVIYE